MSAVALTDHGNMFGAIQLYKACKERGVKAILGCEVNVARRLEGDARATAIDHLVCSRRRRRATRTSSGSSRAGYVEPIRERRARRACSLGARRHARRASSR